MAKKTEDQAREEMQELEAQESPDTESQQPKAEQGTTTETLLIPLDPNGNSDSVYLCVNGKNMIVRRGEPVQVPPEFAEVYRNAQAQQAAAIRAQRAAMSKE